MLVNKISARDSSNTLVAQSTAEKEIAYRTHCYHFPSFKRFEVKQFGVCRNIARVLDVLAAKPLSCDTAAPVHDLCANC